MKIQISKSQARHFLLTKQLLDSPQALSGPDAVEKVFNHLRVIQYDPLNPCGRNTDLVLQSRIKDYHPDGYYKWLYQEKNGIECYDKELCIIPVEDFSLVTHRLESVRQHEWYKSFLKKYESQIEDLLIHIEKRGSLSANNVEYKQQVQGDWSETASFGKVALNVLWKCGRVAIIDRKNGRKYYALPHTIYGKKLSEGETEITKEHIKRRINSVGILPKSGSDGWQGIAPAKLKSELINQMIKSGELVELHVEDSTIQYVALSKDYDLLTSTSQHVYSEARMVFLAPLDNLLWNRAMILDLFNFFYRWEVYTPLLKRKFGYYVLPILYGDQFVGQIEPILNKDKNLEIKGFWKQPDIKWTNHHDQMLNNALVQFQSYLNSKEMIK